MISSGASSEAGVPDPGAELQPTSSMRGCWDLSSAELCSGWTANVLRACCLELENPASGSIKCDFPFSIMW